MGADNKKEQLQGEELAKLIELEEELQQLKREQGMVKEEGKISRFFSSYFAQKDARVLSVVNKRKYLYFLLLTGWCGGHHFYAKRYSTAIMYLLFFWTGFPTAMAIADWLVWLPKVPDENGMIEI